MKKQLTKEDIEKLKAIKTKNVNSQEVIKK